MHTVALVILEKLPGVQSTQNADEIELANLPMSHAIQDDWPDKL